jgi:hypothetical protein
MQTKDIKDINSSQIYMTIFPTQVNFTWSPVSFDGT